MGRLIKRIITMLMFLLSAIYISAPAVYAMGGGMAPRIVEVRTLEEFTDWYESGSRGERCLLMADIEISRGLTLGKTGVPKDINTSEYTIRITSGGSLTLNNPNVHLFGSNAVFTVEKKGRLFLDAGGIHNNPSAPAVLVKQGGYYERKGDFILEGKVYDQNSQPPVDATEPDTGDDLLIPIAGLFEEEFTIYCQEGKAPADFDYPDKVLVSVGVGSFKPLSLPVRWDTASVDFSRAGVYQVKGIFTEETLRAHSLKNPESLAPILHVAVRKSGPIDSLQGEVLSVDSNGNAMIRLKFPALPEEAEGIYLYTSSDGIQYQKARRDIPEYSDDNATTDNFLTDSNTVSPYQYLVYRYQSNYQSLWVKLEIRGSENAGMSNAVECTIPSGARPGTVVHTGGGNDGSSGGNRGGGGQGTSERTGMTDANGSTGALTSPSVLDTGSGSILGSGQTENENPSGTGPAQTENGNPSGTGQEQTEDLSGGDTKEAAGAYNQTSQPAGAEDLRSESSGFPDAADSDSEASYRAVSADDVQDVSAVSKARHADRSAAAVCATAVLVCGLSVIIKRKP